MTHTLKNVAQDTIIGPIANVLMHERFDNQHNLSRFKGKILLLHGMLDTLISPKHSIQLQDYVKKHGMAKSIYLSQLENSDHVHFELNTVFKIIIRFLKSFE